MAHLSERLGRALAVQVHINAWNIQDPLEAEVLRFTGLTVEILKIILK